MFPSHCMHAYMHAKLLQLCPTLWTWCHAPMSMGFSGQEYWSGLPCLPPGDLPNSEMEPTSLMSPVLANGFFTTSTTWEEQAIISGQIRSVAQSCPTLCDPMNCSTLGLPVHHQLPEFTETQVHRVSDAIQPSHPLSTPSPLTPVPPSIRVFSNESTLRMRWPKYCSFSFSIISSKEIPGLISFRMDWLDFLAVQGTL